MLACCCIDQKDTFSQQEPCLFGLLVYQVYIMHPGKRSYSIASLCLRSVQHPICLLDQLFTLTLAFGGQMNMPRLTVIQPVSLYAPEGCLLLLLCQNDRTICCNGQRVLVLRRQAAVQRACGPAVRINFTAVCACVEHWLNCNDHTLF